MKIHSIHLKNINSLKGTHKLSFTEGPLAKTGLFAIIGPTGSGKSTLLDVITLALYNQTPRSGSLSKSAIEKNGAVITRNTEDAHCEVEYEAAGKRYRSRWEISRARTGNLSDYKMFLHYQNEKGNFVAFDLKKGDVPAKNEELIGLNYDQFIKSILLSQGEFAKFLKSKPNERSALLEKITGTEIYTRIGMAAFEKQKTEKQKLDNLKIRLGEVVLLTEEDKQSLSEKAAELQKAIIINKERLGSILRKIQIKQQLNEKMSASLLADERLITLKEKIVALKPDEEKLALHNRLLPLKSRLDQLAGKEKQLPEMTLDIEKIENSIKLLSGRIVELQQRETEVKTHLESKKIELEKMLPVFEQVNNADNEIEVQRSVVKQIAEQLQQIVNEEASGKKELSNYENELKGISEKLLRIDNYLNENPKFETLDGELLVVKSQKKSFDEKLGKIRQLVARDYPLIEKTAGNDFAPAELQSILLKQLRESESEKKQLETFFEGYQPLRHELMEKLTTLHRKAGLLREVLRLAQQINKHRLETDMVTKELRIGLLEVEARQKEQVISSQKIEIIQKLIQELTARKERETLEAKYDEARQQLRPGEPCPLCGAKEHPLVKNYANSLSQTQKELKDQTDLQQKLKNVLEQNNLNITRIIAKNESAAKALGNLEKSIQYDSQEIVKLLESANESLPEIKTDELETRIKSIEAENNRVNENLQHIEELSKVEDIIKSLSALLEKTQELHQAESDLKAKTLTFLKFEETQKPITGQIEILEKKLGHFKEALKQKNEFNDKKIDVATKIRERKNRINELEEEKSRVEKNLRSANEKLNILITSRADLFGDKNPGHEHNQFIEIIGNAEKQHAEISKNISVNEANHRNENDQLRKLTDKLNDTKIAINQLQIELKPKLQASGINSFEAALAALLTDDEAENIGKKTNEVKDALKKTEQTRDDLNLEISKLFTLDERDTTAEQLLSDKKAMDTEISIGEQQKGALTQELKTDDENRNKSARLLDTIGKQEKEYARWEGLNELIGDAKGRKFSTFAQRLTLQQMLAKANHHLKKLTDRYLLINQNMGDEDELFVIDIYHGDEKRSVKTLSGGESFLVSLALALGLSDLAGSKTRISSLFIDEGFGSLDQETLDTALSTLERLQHETNRTIGIISHVEALKERITTQIELTKDANGNSLLRIKS